MDVWDGNLVRLGALTISSELGVEFSEMTGAIVAGGRCFPFLTYRSQTTRPANGKREIGA